MQGFQIWFLPAAIIVFTILVATPLSAYMARIMNGAYRPPRLLRWLERKLDTGPMNWKQYTIALLCFQTVLFVYSYVVMSLQPVAPWNPRHLGMLSPSTIFHSVISFMTNTDLSTIRATRCCQTSRSCSGPSRTCSCWRRSACARSA